ncbi:hypothetical protein CHARACLAT_019698 [Characodon lateralis]|uniref:Uncharacterized protein n=1 Tax=Characodon lateralis TaxID=208331 RepID=A0ABU7D8B7_9TELE|nr:hypothetical protein [Characodon lateralis]
MDGWEGGSERGKEGGREWKQHSHGNGLIHKQLTINTLRRDSPRSREESPQRDQGPPPPPHAPISLTQTTEITNGR